MAIQIYNAFKFRILNEVFVYFNGDPKQIDDYYQKNKIIEIILYEINNNKELSVIQQKAFEMRFKGKADSGKLYNEFNEKMQSNFSPKSFREFAGKAWRLTRELIFERLASEKTMEEFKMQDTSSGYREYKVKDEIDIDEPEKID